MTNPALKLTEEQERLIELIPGNTYRQLLTTAGQPVVIPMRDWSTIIVALEHRRTLRAALDEQVKENERLRKCSCREGFHQSFAQALSGIGYEDCLAFQTKRAETAEAALASTNEITEEKIGAATLAYNANTGGRGSPTMRNRIRAALLAAQGKQPERQFYTAFQAGEPYEVEVTSAPQSPDQACGADAELIDRLRRRYYREWFGIMNEAEADRLLALASRPDTALVRELANQLLTARDQVVAFMLECGYAPETAIENVGAADALITRPDVIAARKGGGQ